MLFLDILKLSRQVLEDIMCVPCSIAKAKRGSIQEFSRLTTILHELVHDDITQKMLSPPVEKLQYGIGFVDNFTVKSDVYFSNTKAGIYKAMVYYKQHS